MSLPLRAEEEPYPPMRITTPPLDPIEIFAKISTGLKRPYERRHMIACEPGEGFIKLARACAIISSFHLDLEQFCTFCTSLLCAYIDQDRYYNLCDRMNYFREEYGKEPISFPAHPYNALIPPRCRGAVPDSEFRKRNPKEAEKIQTAEIERSRTTEFPEESFMNALEKAVRAV